MSIETVFIIYTITNHELKSLWIMILYILRFPFAIICAIYLSANLLTISWSLPSLLSLLSSIIIVMIVFKSSWQHKKWYDFTSSCKACTFFPLDTKHAARSTLHLESSLQRFVPGFLLFLVPLKSRNIPIQILCQSSQYF